MKWIPALQLRPATGSGRACGRGDWPSPQGFEHLW